MLFTGLLTFATSHTFAQSTQDRQEKKSELQVANEKKKADRQRLHDSSDLRKDTKADARTAHINAKEAKRIDKESAYAAKHAKRADKMEVKAQKNRADADKQAKKAAKATTKSNRN